MKAIVVDKDYGSVTAEELERVRTAYAAAGIRLELLDYQVVAAQQKEPTEEEIIGGCQDAQIILATGNPPVTRKVIQALPGLKFVQRFGAGVNSIDLDAAAENNARGMIATLKAPKRTSHTVLMDKVRQIKGVRYLEEL